MPTATTNYPAVNGKLVIWTWQSKAGRQYANHIKLLCAVGLYRYNRPLSIRMEARIIQSTDQNLSLARVMNQGDIVWTVGKRKELPQKPEPGLK